MGSCQENVRLCLAERTKKAEDQSGRCAGLFSACQGKNIWNFHSFESLSFLDSPLQILNVYVPFLFKDAIDYFNRLSGGVLSFETPVGSVLTLGTVLLIGCKFWRLICRPGLIDTPFFRWRSKSRVVGLQRTSERNIRQSGSTFDSTDCEERFSSFAQSGLEFPSQSTDRRSIKSH